jgi:arylsulfatase A-like enzyme
MIIRTFIALLLLCSSAHALDGRREVVIMISDDVGTNGFGTYGETDSVIGNYDTSELTTLAASGQIYRNFTSEPMCSPSRNALWYGMGPMQHGVGRALNEDNWRGVPWAQRESLVSALQAVGVQVHLVGKNHIQDHGPGALLGTAATQAAAMGFDSATAMMLANPESEYPPTAGSPHADGNHHYSWIQMTASTGATVVTTSYTTDVMTTAAVSILQDNSNTDPMLLVIAYSAPHLPFNPPPGEVGSCAATASDSSADCYGPSITYIDDQIPSIVAELDFAEDTFIYISENGRPNNAGDTEHCDRTLSKGHATACGTRVPLVIKGVGVVTNADVSALVNMSDFYNTLAEMFGAPQNGSESHSFMDCFATPASCGTRTISSAIIFDPPGLPVPPEDGQDFSKYEMHFSTVGGTTLYGMNRVYDDANNDVTTFVDTLLDLGSPTTIDQDKRYGQLVIDEPYSGEQQDALAAMQAEATRLIDSRWTGPPNRMVGVTMTGVEH